MNCCMQSNETCKTRKRCPIANPDAGLDELLNQLHRYQEDAVSAGDPSIYDVEQFITTFTFAIRSFRKKYLQERKQVWGPWKSLMDYFQEKEKPPFSCFFRSIWLDLFWSTLIFISRFILDCAVVLITAFSALCVANADVFEMLMEFLKTNGNASLSSNIILLLPFVLAGVCVIVVKDWLTRRREKRNHFETWVRYSSTYHRLEVVLRKFLITQKKPEDFQVFVQETMDILEHNIDQFELNMSGHGLACLKE